MDTIFRLPDGAREELDQFRQEAERFQSGAVAAAEFRSYRVPRGIYEQREADTHGDRERQGDQGGLGPIQEPAGLCLGG